MKQAVIGRLLYAAYCRLDPPGAPWWRLPAVVLGPPVLIVVLVEGLQLAQLWPTWSDWIR